MKQAQGTSTRHGKVRLGSVGQVKPSRGVHPGPAGRMQPRMAVNVAQHKVINLLKTLRDFFVITCHNVFNVWPKTTLLSVWLRDA